MREHHDSIQDSRPAAGHLTTAVRRAPRDALASAVGGGGEMGDQRAKGEPAHSLINPTRRLALPPSLNRVPTELARLYSELGGPAPFRDGIDRKAFEVACNEFTWFEIEPALRPYKKDRDIVRRHWPWVALALSQYRLERKELQRPGAMLGPAEVVEVLTDIHRSAKELANGLARLQKYSHSVADPAAPLRQPHIAYLDEFISQAAAGHIAAEVNESAEHMAHVFFGKQSFLKRIIEVEVAAGEAAKRADKSLLKRKKGQDDPALHNLVWRGAEIWSSLTGRVPSPNKVHRGSGQDPDFVLFIRNLVRLAGGQNPSRKSVETSLRNRRTPDVG